MKSTRRRPRRSTTATTMTTSTLICLIALTSVLIAHATAEPNDDEQSVETTPEVAENLSSEQLQLMSTRAPRQQFRIHQLSGGSSSLPFKLRTIKTAAASTRAKLNGRRQIQAEQNTNATTTTTTTTTSNSTKGKKMISSAVLKKLLSQSLPKLNSTSVFGQLPSSHHRSISAYGPATNTSQSGGPHFKFVFIQRATAAPSSDSAPTSGANVKRPKVYSKSANATSTGTKQQQQSLAASVSRQLANSLFYSAASSLMGNLTSISALANTLQRPDDQSVAINELDVASSSTTTTSATVIAKPAGEDVETNDIRRLSKSSQRVSSSAPAASSSLSSSSATKSSRPGGKPKSRPSKIYNLPVKFVANGQPNHVAAFHSIKQHFATIKKLQSMSTSSGGGGQKKKTSSSNSIPKLKGKNSRLIYLPLKYLSNAKSSSVLSVISAASTKASHKSSTKSGAH